MGIMLREVITDPEEANRILEEILKNDRTVDEGIQEHAEFMNKARKMWSPEWKQYQKRRITVHGELKKIRNVTKEMNAIVYQESGLWGRGITKFELTYGIFPNSLPLINRKETKREIDHLIITKFQKQKFSSKLDWFSENDGLVTYYANWYSDVVVTGLNYDHRGKDLHGYPLIGRTYCQFLIDNEKNSIKVNAIGVNPRFQRRGIGTQMRTAIDDVAKELGNYKVEETQSLTPGWTKYYQSQNPKHS